jgi:hypothetical protein
MSQQAIQQGIAALQAGDTPRGEQLLRQGLADTSLPGPLRAVGYMWLATTNPHPPFQIQCYQLAVQADPTNPEAQKRLDALRQQAQQPPPPAVPLPPDPTTTTAPPTATRPPRPPTTPAHQPGEAPQLWEFSVEGGPNGIGTAFMVVRDGLLATTRYVVGAATEVVVTNRAGHPVEAKVVRSYPAYDLAFIRTRITVPSLRDMTPATIVKPGTPLIADDYTERQEHSRCRDVRSKLPPGWIPTAFDNTLPRSFNGAPLIDDRGDLVGMLTRNEARNAERLYGLHISVIRRKIEAYYTEIQAEVETMYCGACGNLSAAGAAGLYYCESCGATLPFAERTRRTPHPDAALYYPTDRQ